MKTKIGLASLVAGFLMLGSQAAVAEGDAAKGEKIYKKCKACHSLEAGKNKVGPSLAGIFGRTAGAEEGFKYSAAMKDSGIVSASSRSPRRSCRRPAWHFQASRRSRTGWT
jgi:cytochrome c